MEVTHLEPGVTAKMKLYNILADTGVFLPHYDANCVTIESLDNHRNGKFFFYFADQLQIAFRAEPILNGLPDFAYECIQMYHMDKYRKPMPFRHAPTEDYIKIIMQHIDPDNQLELLKSRWPSRYAYNILEINGQLIRWEHNQGQSIQKAVDNHLNKVIKLRNSHFGHTFAYAKALNRFNEERKKIDPEKFELLTGYNKLLFTTNDPSDVYRKIVEDILTINIGVQDNIEVEDDLPKEAIHTAEMSDAGNLDIDSAVSEDEEKLKETLEEMAKNAGLVREQSETPIQRNPIPLNLIKSPSPPKQKKVKRKQMFEEDNE